MDLFKESTREGISSRTKNHNASTKPKIMIICYTVSEIWHVTDGTFIFHFCLFFALLPPYSLKTENFKKMKTRLEITSFYTSVPKIMIKCYIVPETWCMTDIIVIFHLGLSPPHTHTPTHSHTISKK